VKNCPVQADTMRSLELLTARTRLLPISLAPSPTSTKPPFPSWPSDPSPQQSMLPSDKTAQLWDERAPLVRLAMHMPELHTVARTSDNHEHATRKRANMIDGCNT
jgi:hypothetical protein